MKKNGFNLIRIILCFILIILAFILKSNIKLALFIISYILIGYDVLFKSIKNIFHGNLLDENFLMSIATIGAFLINEYPEAVAVMLLYQIGELFQNMAVEKSRKSISSLMEIRPDTANVLKDDKFVKVSPEEVNIEDIIMVRPGEKIPLDGIVIEGESFLDTKAITGESILKKVRANDEVISGFVNQNGILKIKVTKNFKESTVSKILELVENASSKKSKSEKFITKFAHIYTPIVVIISVLITLIPCIIFGINVFNKFITRSLIFLVVSCPCALVISVPLGFFAGIGGASKKGILVKGSNYLENLSKVRKIVFDKTGTLTEGTFKVQKIITKDISEEELIKYASYSEYHSSHPIAELIKSLYKEEINENNINNLEEISGKGIKVEVFGKEVLIGNDKLLKDFNIAFEENIENGTIVYVAIDKKYKGCFVISDKIKENSKEVIKSLKNNYKIESIILTGDIESTSKKVASEIGVDRYYSELLPTDKVSILEEILKERKDNSKVAFVGDRYK